MQKFNIKEFGQLYQKQNPDIIFVIEYGYGEPSEPNFFGYNNIQNIIEFFTRHFMMPFVLYDYSHDFYAKENAMIEFINESLIINIVSYKTSGYTYKFYDEKIYNELKTLISKDAIPLIKYYES
jgi:hypothetical protein